MRVSILVAGALAVGAVVWVASGQVDAPRPQAGADDAPAAKAGEEPPAAVRVRRTVAVARERAIVVNGRTEESRRVTVRAETAGPVVRAPAEEGRPVAPRQIIARLGVEDRKARLEEAEALLRQREIEHQAASRLASKGFRSNAGLAEARARLDAAKARVSAIRTDIARTTVRAPFAGILETRHVETGDFLKVGERVASIVDLDPLLAVGFVAERDVGELRLGGKGAVRLIDGKTVEGRVRYVASVADPSTRSFRVEVEIPNPDGAIRAGLTSELRISRPAVSGHLVSPALLTLSDDGRMGVRIVNGADVVEFVPVEILGDSGAGLWVSGLADGDRLITVGHEFVESGQRVRPVPETEDTAS